MQSLPPREQKMIKRPQNDEPPNQMLLIPPNHSSSGAPRSTCTLLSASIVANAVLAGTFCSFRCAASILPSPKVSSAIQTTEAGFHVAGWSKACSWSPGATSSATNPPNKVKARVKRTRSAKSIALPTFLRCRRVCCLLAVLGHSDLALVRLARIVERPGEEVARARRLADVRRDPVEDGGDDDEDGHEGATGEAFLGLFPRRVQGEEEEAAQADPAKGGEVVSVIRQESGGDLEGTYNSR